MIKPLSIAERLMGMNDTVWARHANPWSVWSRFSILPLFVLAVWSRLWIGWWALALVALVCAWTWLNPRVFPAPKRLGTWASKVVLGEQLYLTRKGEVDAHHIRATFWLGLMTVPAALVMAWGLWAFWWEWAVFGMMLVMISKTWFCDRMVWIYEDLTPQEEA
ncbi:MAG: DUF6653 family protein [Litoreibacter sp.]|uniref:DUF6653 family protein n=1 Tax=Litoreibacter sp. TaxID=1969459 RepID=UPI00329863DC